MRITIKEMDVENAKEINILSAQLGYTLTLEQTISQIEKIKLQNDHLALVAVRGTEVVGWIHAFIAIKIESLPFIEIGGLVIEEAFRNKNIGRKLVESVAMWCRQQKINELRVRCNTKRTGSHLFYKKLNFTETKEQKIFQLDL